MLRVGSSLVVTLDLFAFQWLIRLLFNSKKPALKAWQGTNPITQRSAAVNAANGVSNGSLKNAPALAPSKAAQSTPPQTSQQQQQQQQRNPADKQASDRMLLLVANFIVS